METLIQRLATDRALYIDDGRSEYESMLESVDFAIEEIHKKIDSGRIQNPEHDRVRAQHLSALDADSDPMQGDGDAGS